MMWRPGRAAGYPFSSDDRSLAAFRRDRIALTDRQSALFNWLAMLILGVLTQIAVAVVQLERLRPQALALFVFTAAFATAVALIGLGERPFTGHDIDDQPLRAALASANP